MKKECKYKVCTQCFTYNHIAYIEDAMNGFTIQESNFPVVYCIVDDASTDGEPEVIKKYLAEHFESPYRKEDTEDFQLICAKHKTNANCTFVVLLLKYNHYSIRKPKIYYLSEWRDDAKYIAMCEGDDYWIDQNKLQKQADFMDSHQNHSLCVHAYKKEIMKEGSIESLIVNDYESDIVSIPAKDVLKGVGMFTATASMLYRSEAVNGYPEWAIRAPVGDRPLQLVLLSWGPIGYLNDVMSVYRSGVAGSWTIRVHRNKIENKKTEDLIVRMYKDFDNWTDGRYHCLVRRGLLRFRTFIFRSRIIHAIQDIIGNKRDIL